MMGAKPGGVEVQHVLGVFSPYMPNRFYSIIHLRYAISVRLHLKIEAYPLDCEWAYSCIGYMNMIRVYGVAL